jgi:catechol 2,3-dioxygenase-like lactoylglutathione lyase family enzyme
MPPHAVPGEEEMNVEKISAFTLRIANMQASVRFYRDLLGMKLVYGGEDGCFSSLRMSDSNGPILNPEQGNPVAHWGRLVFYVSDVDTFWAYLKEKGLRPVCDKRGLVTFYFDRTFDGLKRSLGSLIFLSRLLG